MSNNIKMKNQGIGVSAAMIIAMAGLATSTASAGEFGSGEWSGNIDTTVSYGASWRINDYDPNDVGKAANNPTAFLLPNASNRAAIGRWSNNDDDGDLNYANARDLITHAFKVTTEIDIRSLLPPSEFIRIL